MKLTRMKAVVALMAATIGLVQAETVTNTYALVAGWGNANVNLYKVGDDGLKWSFIRTVRAASDGKTTWVSDAVRVGDVVYVLDMINEVTTSERFIRKYALDGSGYLGDLTSLGTDREAGCMCLSSDGQSLYVGYTFRTAAGKVDKVSLADGTVTKDFAIGLGAIRQLATDGKGHLYAGNRGGALSIVSETDGRVLTTVAGDASGTQGVAYDPINDCCWWSKSNASNYGTFSFAEPSTVTMGLSLTDGAWGAHCFAVATLDGLPYFGSFTDKKIYRRAADGTIAAITDGAGNAITYPVSICGLTFFREEVEGKDVARVYVTLPGTGVKTYLVNNKNEWRFEGTFVANAAGKMDRPVAFHKAGDFFYACDQHEDKQLGYFSVSRFDAWGAFHGRIVDKCMLTAPKADNMTVSPDGKYLYVSCFNGGSLLRVSTADGTVESFTTTDVSNSRGACTSSDGTIFVANRGKSAATAYDPRTGETKGSYGRVGASGVFCDDEAGLVYVSDNDATGNVSVYNRDGSSAGVALTGTGNCMAIAKVNGRIVFGNWTGAIMTYEPGSGVTTPTTVLSGLGNIQHLYVEPIVEDTRVRPDGRTISFSAPETGDWYVARDEGLGVANAAEKTTVWKSTDKGQTWSEQAVIAGVLRPSVYTCSGRTILFGEKVRASESGPLVVTAYELKDGNWTPYVESFGVGAVRAPGAAARLSGGVVAMPRMFGGVRPFVPTTSGRVRKFGAFSLLDPSRNNPDPCFAMENVVLSDYFGNANATWRDEKNPLDALAEGTAVALPSDGVAMLLPNVQRRSATADRLSEECVLVSTNWAAGNGPTIVGWAKLPGGSKPLAAFWDAPSACYWAVTTPETNMTHILMSEPNDTRNVLALYASENLFDWRSAGVIRAEGTPETVAFDRPCAAADGDDLVLVYKSAGASSASGVTALTADGGLVFQRVANFRTRKPSFAKDAEILLSANYTLSQVDRYVKDPATGAWRSDGVFASGRQRDNSFVNLVGMASACGRVYVASETVGVFEFTLKGRCSRLFAKPEGHNVDAIVVSSDGRTAWVTDCTSNSSAVMKLDLETGAWTILCEIANGMPRALAVAKDGSFYVGCRALAATGNIRHYTADGTSYETLDLGFGDVISLALNEEDDVLYCGSRYGRVVKVELTNGNRQTELTSSGLTLENGAFSILPKGDTLYCVDGTAAIQYALDANEANQLPVPLVGGGLFLGRSTFVDTSYKRGFLLLVR